MKTVITFREICHRQDLIPLMETRKQGLEPYMMDRTDMFWAEVNITDDGLKAELTYCIDSRHHPQPWTLSFQFGSGLLDTEETRQKVMKKWLASPEHIKAAEWVSNLRNAGYFDRGRAYAPNANHAECKHCGDLFEIGTSHPHTILPAYKKDKARIIYHHKLMEKTIAERDLTRQGVSALPDIPSLEEKGKLDWHTVGSEA